jgi:hypothetical protein
MDGQLLSTKEKLPRILKQQRSQSRQSLAHLRQDGKYVHRSIPEFGCQGMATAIRIGFSNPLTLLSWE